MKGLMPRTHLFLKRNSSTVLTCVGAFGVIATAVAAVNATPKVMKLLDKAREEKHDELTKIEVVKIAAPAYIPSVLIGASTIGCIFGANILNKRHQAALTSAYTVLGQTYNAYRNSVKNVFGEEGERHVIHDMVDIRTEDIPEKNDGKMTFMDFTSLQIFDSTMEDVYKAEDYINDILNKRGFVLLSEFYEALGTKSIIDDDSMVGWTKAMLISNRVDHVAFVHDIVTKSDGEECCIITPVIDPAPANAF